MPASEVASAMYASDGVIASDPTAACRTNTATADWKFQARLNSELNKVLQAPDLREKLAQQFYEPVGGTPERFAAAIRADMDRYGRAIKEAGIKPE